MINKTVDTVKELIEELKECNEELYVLIETEDGELHYINGVFDYGITGENEFAVILEVNKCFKKITKGDRQMIKGERIPKGKVNLYTFIMEDEYNTEAIKFCSNIDYDYEILKNYVRKIARVADGIDEFIDRIRDELELSYIEEYKPIEVAVMAEDIRFCPYCGESVDHEFYDSYAQCERCNVKFSTNFEGWIKRRQLEDDDED